jgi:hypothetical protein
MFNYQSLAGASGGRRRSECRQRIARRPDARVGRSPEIGYGNGCRRIYLAMAEKQDGRDLAAELAVMERQVAEGRVSIWALTEWVTRNMPSERRSQEQIRR